MHAKDTYLNGCESCFPFKWGIDTSCEVHVSNIRLSVGQAHAIRVSMYHIHNVATVTHTSKGLKSHMRDGIERVSKTTVVDRNFANTGACAPVLHVLDSRITLLCLTSTRFACGSKHHCIHARLWQRSFKHYIATLPQLHASNRQPHVKRMSHRNGEKGKTP